MHALKNMRQFLFWTWSYRLRSCSCKEQCEVIRTCNIVTFIFQSSWYEAAIRGKDIQCGNPFLFPKPIWKGMVWIATYIMTDPVYVQIAMHISKCALQEQLLREGYLSVVAAYAQKGQSTCHLLYWQWWTDRILWLQILLVHWLYWLHCHKENLRIWIFLWRSQKNSRPVMLCFTLFNTTCKCMNEWQGFFFILDPIT